MSKRTPKPTRSTIAVLGATAKAETGRTWNEFIQQEIVGTAEKDPATMTDDELHDALFAPVAKPHIEQLFAVIQGHQTATLQAMNRNDFRRSTFDEIRENTKRLLATIGITDEMFDWSDSEGKRTA